MRLVACVLLLCASCSATEGELLQSGVQSSPSPSADMSPDLSRPPLPDVSPEMSAALVACANDCLLSLGGLDCPTALGPIVSYCLESRCGGDAPSAAGNICELPSGAAPTISEVLCARQALASCGSGSTSCQGFMNSKACLAFSACVQTCPQPRFKCCKAGVSAPHEAPTCDQGTCMCPSGYDQIPYGTICD